MSKSPKLNALAADPKGRSKILTLIERHAKAALTPAEYAVYSLIADRTLRFNKRWERITTQEVVCGKRTRDGRWIHRGVKLGERHAYRVLKSLLDKECIHRQPWGEYGNSFEYSINLDSAVFDECQNSITWDSQ